MGAISEATGATPVAIGRMLAEIRQENLHERFGRKIETHETKISTLEQRTERLARARREHIDPEVAREIEEVARERIRKRQQAPYAIGIIFILGVILLSGICSKSQPFAVSPYPVGSRTVSTDIGNGEQLTVNERGDVWVKTKDGGRRQPTEKERQDAIPLLISVSRKSP